jgi:hypothetical protein
VHPDTAYITFCNLSSTQGCFMARAVYPHEMSDPDFEWLLSTYSERVPHGIRIDQPGMPFTIVTLEGLTLPTPLEAMLSFAQHSSASALPVLGEDKDTR